MNMKRIAVIISGVPEDRSLRELEIQAGTTAGDVLRSLGLDGQYLLSREGSAQAFANEEEIYEVVPDGGKLRCTPVAEVGGGPWLIG
jgi:hypothetical protein